ncbi:lipopolysaccharide biosynthesis protein [Dyella jiangningensis]|uniref:Polysaccharide biosynthesis protein n=1 Tax=Dyella jiangningensis TaxID=1379159 RepID=A0A328P5P3_9GAMM|nr:oligosaccharide flippase family protein [Dyella jiangningensis]RAO75554.1 polysaccharide biosynthesis protein [Dyella jiangningensis]
MKGAIARGTIRTTFILGLYTLVQAGTLLLVARMLGPYQFGAFAGVAALAALLGTISTFGTNIVLLGEVAKAPSRRGQILPYAIPITLLCGGALLAIYFATCLLALRAANVPWSMLLAIGVAELWLQPLFGLATYEHHGLGRVAGSQLLKTLPLALRLVAAAGIFLMRANNPLVAYSYIYPALSLLALVFAVRTLPSAWPSPRQWRLPSVAELREAAGYAAIAITASGPGELDKALATKLLPLSMAGVYSAGARVIVATTLPVNALMASAMPRLFRERLDHPELTSRLLLRIFGATLVYMLAITVILWSIAPVFEWLFGAKYHGLDHTLRWLCLAAPGLALRMTSGTILMALGKPWVRVGFEITGIVVLVIAAIAFTARFGAVGLPWALACSEWAMAIIGTALILDYMTPSRTRA